MSLWSAHPKIDSLSQRAACDIGYRDTWFSTTEILSIGEVKGGSTVRLKQYRLTHTLAFKLSRRDNKKASFSYLFYPFVGYGTIVIAGDTHC